MREDCGIRIEEKVMLLRDWVIDFTNPRRSIEFRGADKTEVLWSAQGLAASGLVGM